MFMRLFVAMIAVAGFALSGSAARANHEMPRVHAARVTFVQPTRVNGSILLGSYVIVHDEDQMARGEPCTTFYRLNAGKRAEAVVKFHCVPRKAEVVARPALRTCAALGPVTATNLVELVDYQFAGDSEAHGVPGVGR